MRAGRNWQGTGAALIVAAAFAVAAAAQGGGTGGGWTGGGWASRSWVRAFLSAATTNELAGIDWTSLGGASAAGAVLTNHSGNVTIDGATVLTNSAVLLDTVVVSGDGDPSPNGTYTRDLTELPTLVYFFDGGVGNLWLLSFTGTEWVIENTESGVFDYVADTAGIDGLFGTYTAQGGNTGAPVVSGAYIPALRVQGAVSVSGDVEAGSLTVGGVKIDDWSDVLDFDALFEPVVLDSAAGYTVSVARVAYETDYVLSMSRSNLLSISAASFPTNRSFTIALSLNTAGHVITADTNVIDATMWQAISLQSNGWDKVIFDRGFGQQIWGVQKGGAN